MSGPQETTASRSSELTAALNSAASVASAAVSAVSALTTAASGQPPPPGKINKFYYKNRSQSITALLF